LSPEALWLRARRHGLHLGARRRGRRGFRRRRPRGAVRSLRVQDQGSASAWNWRTVSFA